MSGSFCERPLVFPLAWAAAPEGQVHGAAAWPSSLLPGRVPASVRVCVRLRHTSCLFWRAPPSRDTDVRGRVGLLSLHRRGSVAPALAAPVMNPCFMAALWRAPGASAFQTFSLSGIGPFHQDASRPFTPMSLSFLDPGVYSFHEICKLRSRYCFPCASVPPSLRGPGRTPRV